MERKCTQLVKSGYERDGTELVLSREVLFFFFLKDGRGRRNRKGEVEGKSWLFPDSEIW